MRTAHPDVAAQEESVAINTVLSAAIGITLFTSLVIVLRYHGTRLKGQSPLSLFAFIAVLFTSGLDVGLIMFPMTEFPVYESEAVYSLTNALAIEFGFWGFLVWAFYFLTTFYFCVIEPELKLFELTWVKFINNTVIIATCAFTGFLFLSYLPDYIIGIQPLYRFGLVALVVLLAVLSSSELKYVKWLSISSSMLFLGLIMFLFFASGMSVSDWTKSAFNVTGYFANIHKFLSPVSDYHAFYLFWWFSWSIMIGQFVARFVGGLKVWQLFLALLTIPSIPILLWFSVLYHYHTSAIELVGVVRACMVVVGIIFVINSLDSLTRLYSENINFSVKRFGKFGYTAIHWCILYGLILLYQFTPLKIEWIGLIVIGLYVCIYTLIYRERALLPAAISGGHK